MRFQFGLKTKRRAAAPPHQKEPDEGVNEERERKVWASLPRDPSSDKW